MTNRKFKFACGLAVLYTALLITAFIDKGVFAGLMGTLVPLYFAANVGQKALTSAAAAKVSEPAGS